MSKSITVKTGDSPTLPLESIKKRTVRCVFQLDNPVYDYLG